MVQYSHHFKNLLQFVVIHTVKGFGIISKAEGDVFWNSLAFFDDPMDVGSLISGSSALHLEIHSSHTVEAWRG